MIKTFNVQLLAFGKPGEIREVDVFFGNVNPDNPDDIGTALELVFYYGQNDHQPKKHPSVSMGDVIEFGNDKYLVKGVGFHKMTDDEYNRYVGLERRDRHFDVLLER